MSRPQTLSEFQSQRVVERIRHICLHPKDDPMYKLFCTDHEENPDIKFWTLYAGTGCRYNFATSRSGTYLPEHSIDSLHDLYMYLCMDVYEDQIKYKFNKVPATLLDSDNSPDQLRDFKMCIKEYLNNLVDWGSDSDWHMLDDEKVYPITEQLSLYLRERHDGYRCMLRNIQGNVLLYFMTYSDFELTGKCKEASSVADIYHILVKDRHVNV